MESAIIREYDYVSVSYFKIDRDKFEKAGIKFYEDGSNHNHGDVKLLKFNYEKLSANGTNNFYNLVRKLNEGNEWDSMLVKDLETLLKIFTLVDCENQIMVNITGPIQIAYKKGIVTIHPWRELSFLPEKLLSHAEKDSLLKLIESNDKTNVELALILISNG